MEQCGSVAQCGGTVWNGMEEQWKSVVEQWNRGTMWNNMVGEWNSVAVWHSVVEQCGTEWWNREQCGGTV